MNFLLYYTCSKCRHEWQDVYDCAVNADCPECGQKDIEPEVEDVPDRKKEGELQVTFKVVGDIDQDELETQLAIAIEWAMSDYQECLKAGVDEEELYENRIRVLGSIQVKETTDG